MSRQSEWLEADGAERAEGPDHWSVLLQTSRKKTDNESANPHHQRIYASSTTLISALLWFKCFAPHSLLHVTHSQQSLLIILVVVTLQVEFSLTWAVFSGWIQAITAANFSKSLSQSNQVEQCQPVWWLQSWHGVWLSMECCSVWTTMRWRNLV